VVQDLRQLRKREPERAVSSATTFTAAGYQRFEPSDVAKELRGEPEPRGERRPPLDARDLRIERVEQARRKALDDRPVHSKEVRAPDHQRAPRLQKAKMRFDHAFRLREVLDKTEREDKIEARQAISGFEHISATHNRGNVQELEILPRDPTAEF